MNSQIDMVAAHRALDWQTDEAQARMIARAYANDWPVYIDGIRCKIIDVLAGKVQVKANDNYLPFVDFGRMVKTDTTWVYPWRVIVVPEPMHDDDCTCTPLSGEVCSTCRRYLTERRVLDELGEG